MAKHKTLAFFIPHLGCPHRCSFCDQHVISGRQTAPEPAEIAETCENMLRQYGIPQQTEAAFFGGSFTAVPIDYQNALLEAVQPYMGTGGFCGIRISTRPDAIDKTILARLKRYHVTAIELGAQSMSDRVLDLNRRGHSAQAVREAGALIRDAGFSLGLQQMIGLYGSSLRDEYDTLEQLLACHPNTMRFYPTVVLKGTFLAEVVKDGGYPALLWDEVIDFGSDALCCCRKQGVTVLRMGLHDSPSLQENRIAGYYHPAFGEVVESRLYRRALEKAAADHRIPILSVETAPGTLSKLLGQHSCNRKFLAAKGIHLTCKESQKVKQGELLVNGISCPVYVERQKI